MLASSRGDFFAVVLNPATPQRWTGLAFEPKGGFTNSTDQMQSKNVESESIIPGKDSVTSGRSKSDPRSTAAPFENTDPLSEQPVASAEVVSETNSPVTLKKCFEREYKIESAPLADSIANTKPKTVTSKDGKLITEVEQLNVNPFLALLSGSRALWRVGKLKRPKRSPKSLRWKPVVKGETHQEGSVAYDAGIIWKPILQNDARLSPLAQPVDNSNETQSEQDTVPTLDNENKEKTRNQRSRSDPGETKYELSNKLKEGKIISQD